jgi:putative ABC transport system permease protein
MSDQYINLSWAQVAWASALVVGNALLSVLIRLGLERRLVLAAVRMLIQLVLIGAVLNWVFTLRRWYAVVPLMLAMSLIGSLAAVQQTSRRYPGVWLDSIVSVFTSSWLMILVAVLLIVRVHPWYSPQYAIPLAGMILGNTLSGISLTLDRFAEELTSHRDQIEALLALGATRKEAAREAIRNAVATGLMPTINFMVLAGIVTLPGTMTGQLLAGVDPLSAVKYQIVIMFLLVSGTVLGTLCVTLLSYRRLFNARHQFLYSLISTPEKGPFGAFLAP